MTLRTESVLSLLFLSFSFILYLKAFIYRIARWDNPVYLSDKRAINLFVLSAEALRRWKAPICWLPLSLCLGTAMGFPALPHTYLDHVFRCVYIYISLYEASRGFSKAPTNTTSFHVLHVPFSPFLSFLFSSNLTKLCSPGSRPRCNQPYTFL